MQQCNILSSATILIIFIRNHSYSSLYDEFFYKVVKVVGFAYKARFSIPTRSCQADRQQQQWHKSMAHTSDIKQLHEWLWR